MNFLKYEFDAGPTDLIEVTVDKQANVRLLDWANFQKYQSGQQHTYYGGNTKVSPVRLRPPRQAHWYVVVDLGGYSGSVRAYAQKINSPQQRTA